MSVSAPIQTKTQGFDNLGIELEELEEEVEEVDTVLQIKANNDPFSDSDQRNPEEIKAVNDLEIDYHHVTSPQCTVRKNNIDFFLKADFNKVPRQEKFLLHINTFIKVWKNKKNFAFEQTVAMDLLNNFMFS